ncbi:cytochrome c biogenesis protein ResC [Paenibacillus sp. J31TS4]|uniref:cytochrome c biogenesis protein CcsA n=1 Tax=Paenibacillus sp. J31TS4 TaxID=2807195 RepID=UPI001B1C3FC4|nr:cytochrome c biogenesis protein CcsA [Paenibacillus sp. J31TS4]GIP37509.1 cytochrome c biogenesis protein ResC [Paenibacillus sp. J31TS4]
MSFIDKISSASSSYLLVAFLLYCLAFILFVVSITGKRMGGKSPEAVSRRFGSAGFIMTVVGFAAHLLFFFTRWYASGHIPTSNMYEFMTFLGMMIILAFIIVYLIYRLPVLGVFALPVGFIVLAYASVFPSEMQPLIPALQSYWLKIHVTTAAAGEAFFGVGFAAGLMHLARTIRYKGDNPSPVWERRAFEWTIVFILLIVAFIGSVFSFNAAGYKATFVKEVTVSDTAGQPQVLKQDETYVLPPIVQPSGSQMVEMKPFLGMTKPLFEAPSWMEGKNAGRQLNTVIWSVIFGALLYGILRLLARKPLGAVLNPAVQGLDPEDLDEVGYRAIAIGYPIFTLGALIFAMIWAHEAWGRFWGWDPKEVWAFITWLFYAVYLHLRLSRGWQGKKSSWLSVIGFIVVMFTLIGVNLLIAGLHSYAGV